MKEITTKAGYNRGTFYEYFTDVYDTLEWIEKSLLPDLSTHMQHIHHMHHIKSLLLEPAVMQHIKHVVKIYQERSKYFVILLGDNGDPSFQGKIRNILRPALEQLFSTTSNDDDDFIRDYTIEYTISAMIGVLNYGFRREKNPPIKKLIQLIYNLTADGIMKNYNYTINKNNIVPENKL